MVIDKKYGGKALFVSILMTVYKEPKEWIESSVKSVLSQSYSNFELIIVDDNPDDIVLEKFLLKQEKCDGRIQVIFNNKNVGLTRSLNKACRMMRGRYVARIDADDIWGECKLQKQVDYLNSHPDVDVCGTWIKLIDENGEITGSYVYPTQHIDIVKQMMFSNPIVHSSVVIRSSVIKNRLSQVYNEDCLTSQDYELWTSLYFEGAVFANLPDYLTLYRCSSQQVSKVKKESQKENANKISCNFIKKLFYRINIENYLYLSCNELSYFLKNAKIDKSLKPVYYHYLWVKYYTSSIDKLSLLNILLRTGDICRFTIKNTIKLLFDKKSDNYESDSKKS